MLVRIARTSASLPAFALISAITYNKPPAACAGCAVVTVVAMAASVAASAVPWMKSRRSRFDIAVPPLASALIGHALVQSSHVSRRCHPITVDSLWHSSGIRSLTDTANITCDGREKENARHCPASLSALALFGEDPSRFWSQGFELALRRHSGLDATPEADADDRRVS